jgi:hypothetical protein
LHHRAADGTLIGPVGDRSGSSAVWLDGCSSGGISARAGSADRASGSSGCYRHLRARWAADGPATFTFPKILKEKDGGFELFESDLDKKGKSKALEPKKLRLKSRGDTVDSDVEYDPESAIIDKGCSQKLVQDLGTQWTVVGALTAPLRRSITT